MTAPKSKDWMLGVVYTDTMGGSRQEITENITEATAKSRATAACKNGYWLGFDSLGLKMLIPPHKIRGIWIKKMEASDE